MKLFKKHIYIIGNRPQTDWRRILSISIILALVVSVYSFFFYRTIKAQSLDSEKPVVMTEKNTATSTAAVKPDEGGKLELNQIIELYLNKKETYQKMLDGLKNS